jgi:hypothetical protein
MTIETITLVGGSYDGMAIEWRGGNWLRMFRREPVELRPIAEGRPDPSIRLDEELYERSTRDPSKFIFMPSKEDGVDVR